MKPKTLIALFTGVAGFLLLLPACKIGSIRSFYRPVFPELPAHWEKILGNPRWRLEWVDENGAWQEWEGVDAPELSLIQEWTSPVLAWPYWPERDLIPGMMRPSGALFPWDVSGGSLVFGWKGGVEAIFWKELAMAERPTEASEGRLPWYFDWSRFRELLESVNIPDKVREDLWLADWKDIAVRTVMSGFDRRRIVSRSFSELVIPDIGGFWAGSSPFAPAFEAPAEGPLKLSVAETPDTWVAVEGILKCSVAGWVLRKP